MKKIVLFAILLTAFAPITSASADEASSFGRKELVVISGEALGQLFGAPPDKLSLLAKTPGGFEPVPFQIDQRYRKGKRLVYAYTGGKRARPDPDPTLDGLDELVFWSGDAGPRVSTAQWPGSGKGVEIAIDDPLTGAKGYVYLLSFPDKAPRSDRRYVLYDPETDSVEALYYNLAFPKKHKVGFVDFAITTQAGGSGEDFVDEAKYRLTIRLAGTLIPYEIDKEQVHSKVRAWIDGPVRVRRKVRNYVELWIWLGSTSCAESAFGPAGFSIEVPVIGTLPKALTNNATRWAMELNKHALGMTFRSDKNLQAVTIDGKMSVAERGLDFSPPKWMLLSGRPGTVLRQAGKMSKRPLYLDLYYMDNAKLEEPPEREPGQLGAGGYYIPFPGWRGAKVRENIIEFFDILPNYRPGDEEAFLGRASKPLSITVSSVTVENSPSGPTKWPPPKKARKVTPVPTYKYAGAEAPEIESQVIPVIVASSDNGFGGGLMYVHANPFNTGVRLMTQAWYTIKTYSMLEFQIGEDVPKPGSDWAWIAYTKYRLRPGRDFYGLGNDSYREDQTNFFDELFTLKLWAKRHMRNHFWLGAFVDLHHDFIGHGEGDWCPDTFSRSIDWFPEEDLLGKGEWWTNRIGWFLLMDTRDSYYIPTRGGYRKIEYYAVPKWLGGDFTFEYWHLDVRQFIPIRKPRKDILALRLQVKHAEGGPIPFYELAVAGSEYTMRGFFNGRFRDRDMICLNTEWRHNLWKIVDIHFFYDVGRVFNDIFEEGHLIPTDLHPAWGTGFRITIPPNIVMRGDIGWSVSDQVFYFNWGQTF